MQPSVADFQRPQALEQNQIYFFLGHAPRKKYCSAASVRARRARARSRLHPPNLRAQRSGSQISFYQR